LARGNDDDEEREERAEATLQTSADSVQVHCAVAASASDINMSGGLTIGAGDTVSCSSLTYTAPA